MIPLLLLYAASDCPTAEIPAALTQAATDARTCFFGNPTAAENAFREVAAQADCVQLYAPPACFCNSIEDGTKKMDCGQWATKLVKFYIPDASEAELIHNLTTMAAKACQTSDGSVIPPEQQGSIKPDSLPPACHRIQPAAPADLAAFTVGCPRVSPSSPPFADPPLYRLTWWSSAPQPSMFYSKTMRNLTSFLAPRKITSS